MPPSRRSKLPDGGIIEQAKDIFVHPKSKTPQGQGYMRARELFWKTFPNGKYVRLPTPGDNMECAFYALRISIRHQFPDYPPHKLPGMEELRDVYFNGEMARLNKELGLGELNENDFFVDQLSVVVSEWGERRGERWQLGYVTDGKLDEVDGSGLPAVLDTSKTVKASDEGGEEIIRRVWVYNDGLSLYGRVGHYEGMRAVREGEDTN